MIGEIFHARYEMHKQLGKTAGRRTLLAKDVVTDELVIVKLLAFSSDFEWDDLKLFEREAETLKSLSHPSIPRYLDYFEVNSPTIKGFALVQSYIPSPTLEQYIQSGRTFSESDVQQIARAILEILIYLHGLYPPVIHRDIKPSNILLGERSGHSVGQVYLVDFGSVQTALHTEGGTRTVVGTYGYMPPEQFGGRTVPASDLYSLGATLIYLVTGSHPADLPQKDFRIQFASVVSLSSGLTNWLNLMIEPSLERRLDSAQAALTALDQPELTSTTSTLTIGKPAGSKIHLTKNEDSLEIFIPPVGSQPGMVFTGLFAIAWNSFILYWTINAISTSALVGLPLPLFSLPFWGVGYLMVYTLLMRLFGSVRLRLHSQQISLTRELFGFKFHRPRPSPRDSITKLVYIQPHLSKDADGTQTQTPAQLYIWAGIQKYQLGMNTGIKSAAELEWLAQELSNWLDMPVDRE
ncbi:serine/threonine-protein kinase [Nostoc sp. TCL26-01]|uniref:serine/threonine protein kinase n=1 Tax=Nostoc sp. TCL26-01 TaxID=2576904 RepID=UPI0015BE9E59|nr:serine/threonine-protein kinase [Nostoc sp. TCL26-01]QLE57231.1 serine/threonine protein kinase [Nostoc sp. TCL26-01]